jgi:AcrR family transcriptional regulator
VKERRRGEELEAAILAAAWAELQEVGYARLTMEAVAARAGTSRPVLARRWSGRAELALAAIRAELARHPLMVPDLGDLRAELMELMRQSAERSAALAAIILVIFGEYAADTGTSPEAFRARIFEGEAAEPPAILARAVARGEIAPGPLKPEVAGVLSNLFRHHIMMNLKAPEPELYRQWVDDVFLPLVRRPRP